MMRYEAALWLPFVSSALAQEMWHRHVYAGIFYWCDV
jgi:hypothetical protein